MAAKCPEFMAATSRPKADNRDSFAQCRGASRRLVDEQAVGLDFDREADGLGLSRVEFLHEACHPQRRGWDDAPYEVREAGVESKQFVFNGRRDQNLPEEEGKQRLLTDGEEV